MERRGKELIAPMQPRKCKKLNSVHSSAYFSEQCIQEVQTENLEEPREIKLQKLWPIAPDLEVDQTERKFLLKVYTWGEVIPHMWLWMWVISNKLTAYIPMEWRAGDDNVG